MILLQLESSPELINLDYLVKVHPKSRVIYLNEEGIGLVPYKLTREEYQNFITCRDVRRIIL